MNLKTWAQGWLKKFDIKPSPPLISTFWEECQNHYASNNFHQAMVVLEKIQKITPNDREVFKLLISCCILMGNFSKALIVAQTAQQNYPNEALFEHQLGYIYVQLEQFKSAVKHYQRALFLNPHAEGTRYLLAAVQGKENVKPPAEYITSLFDSYASVFEHEMLNTLQYAGHVQLADFFQETLPYTAEQRLQGLDLGCGTGLLGRELLKRYPNSRLTGVDLSPAILSEAEKKAGYYELIHAEMQDYVICQPSNRYDLIAASDSFIYLGDLFDMLQACYHCLKPGGWLGFSVEAKKADGYHLQPLGRFQHSKSYIQKLQRSIGFKSFSHRAMPFRREKSLEVLSYLFLLQK